MVFMESLVAVAGAEVVAEAGEVGRWFEPLPLLGWSVVGDGKAVVVVVEVVVDTVADGDASVECAT